MESKHDKKRWTVKRICALSFFYCPHWISHFYSKHREENQVQNMISVYSFYIDRKSNSCIQSSDRWTSIDHSIECNYQIFCLYKRNTQKSYSTLDSLPDVCYKNAKSNAGNKKNSTHKFALQSNAFYRAWTPLTNSPRYFNRLIYVTKITDEKMNDNTLRYILIFLCQNLYRRIWSACKNVASI